MENEKLIKSSSRVKKHGEVFTPQRIVNLMLDQIELKDELSSVTSTFLEPAAGEGAFLTEILRRKLAIVREKTHSLKSYEQNALLALTSLYGIELLEDNTELLVMNMYQTFYRDYIEQLTKYEVRENKSVLNSAMIIISANMAQGNSLTGLNGAGEPIILSEWRLLPSKNGFKWVKRVEYTFEAILNGGPALSEPYSDHRVEQMSLFDSDSSHEISLFESGNFQTNIPVNFAPCKISDVYLEKLA